MNRSEKQQLIDELHKELEQAPHAVLLDFKGLSVPAATEFRRKLRASGARYRVVKNSLALRAAKGTALERLESRLEGTTGIAYTGSDPVALAKALVDFAKDNPALSVKAGVVAGSQMLDAEGVKALSTMPGLAELRARLLGLLQAPATQLVRLLGTPATQLARVVQARQDKLEKN
jgi:large subunit ribosomal protein L10